MTINRRTLLGGAVAATAAASAAPAAAQTIAGERLTRWPPRETFRLWPGNAPGSPAVLPVLRGSMNGARDDRELWVKGIARPSVSVFRASRPNGRGVLSIPGGGYSFLSVENEGIDVARALNPLGYTVFVLTYRLPNEGWLNRADVPLQDAQRAIRLIRSRTVEYKLQPGKLAVLGFSAGGHLAASLVTAHGDRVYEPIDAADRFPARPDCAGLVYPVTSIAMPISSSASRGNLVGATPSDAVVARYSADKRVTTATPPLFFVHAIDDPVVPVDMSLSMLAAARSYKVPAEAHLYETGGHGFGPALAPDHPAHGWPDLFARFTKRHLG